MSTPTDADAGGTVAAALTVGDVARLAQRADRANEAIQIARLMLGTLPLGTEQEVIEGQSIDDYLFEAQEETRQVHKTLRARCPLPEGDASLSGEGDLAGLMLLDSPDARELLRLVTEAVAVAECVDRSRGRALSPDFPLPNAGETYGTDLAETLSEIALRLRIEVEGPRGRE